MNILGVAKKAGVSKATVSRVINGTARVSPETAESVRKAIRDLDYYPNISAQTLGSGKSSLYGLIISDITNPYFPELVKAFEEIAEKHGQDVLISNTNYDPKRMERCVIRMLQRKVDGVAVMTSEIEARLIKTFSKRQIPMIFMDAPTSVKGASVVRVDYAHGVRAAVKHLLSLGHKNISFISGPLNLASARVRADAFVQELKDHGLPVRNAWVREGNHKVEGGHQAMLRILSSRSRPTAVLASNDLTAIGAMGAIRERGLQIPDDISVVGFDDIQLSSYTQPPLTTVRVSRRELAETAFLSLYRSGERAPAEGQQQYEFVVKGSLIVRGSTSDPPKASLSNSSRQG